MAAWISAPAARFTPEQLGATSGSGEGIVLVVGFGESVGSGPVVAVGLGLVEGVGSEVDEAAGSGLVDAVAVGDGLGETLG